MGRLARRFREYVSLLRLGSYVVGRRYFHRDDEGDEWRISADEQYCVAALKATSRSFAEVIQALGPELRAVVRVFYLVLRGLDAVEDDMSVELSVRTSLLSSFHERLLRSDDVRLLGVGPSPEERDLLAHFDCVSRVFQTRIEAKYQDIILDTTKKMAAGMVEMAEIVTSGSLRTADELRRYAYYVAGLVGVGLSQLFAASGTESAEFAALNDASISMGLFLQLTNIIRDFAEDHADGKVWWPRDITAQYVVDHRSLLDASYQTAALACLNHMIADAFVHCSDALDYLSRLRDVNNLRFCAVPQVMALATLARCYNEPQIFQPQRGRVKISRAQAADIFIGVDSLPAVYAYYRTFVDDLAAKVDPHDPNAARLRSSIAVVHDKLRQLTSQVDSLPRSVAARPPATTRSAAVALLLVAVVAGFWLKRRRATAPPTLQPAPVVQHASRAKWLAVIAVVGLLVLLRQRS